MHLLLLSVVLQWGLAFVAIKLVLDHASPLGLTVIRFVITGGAFAIMMALWKGARARVERRDRGRFLVMAVVGVTGYHLSLNYGEQFVSAGVAALIIASMPVLVALLAVRFLGERISGTKAIGIGSALAGVVVLVFLGTPGASLEISDIGGAAAVALSPICWSIYTVMAKPLVARYGGLPVTAITMAVGTLLLLPVGLPAALRDAPRLDASDWGWIAFLALGCTVYAYAVWNIALTKLEASSTAAWVYVVPLFSLTWGWILLGERLTVWVILGGALVLGGVILTERVAPRLVARDERLVAEPAPEAA